MKVMNSINNLEEYKVKGMILKGDLEDEGQTYLTSEAGVEFNTVRWENYKHTLTLQNLTYTETETIIKDFRTAKKNEEKITISKTLLSKRKYLDMKDTPGEPVFSFEMKDVKPSSQAGTKFYQLAIKLVERVNK